MDKYHVCLGCSAKFGMFWKVSGWSGKLLGGLKSSHIVWNVSGWYGKFQDGQESFWRVLKYLRWFWYFPDGLQSFQVVWKMSECIGKFCGWYCKFSDCLVVRKVSPLQIVFSKGKKFRDTSCSSCTSCNATRGPPCTFSNPI